MAVNIVSNNEFEEMEGSDVSNAKLWLLIWIN